MSDLSAQFAQAQTDANTLPKRPDNETLLKLYALYKQAIQGDVQGEQPAAFDFVKRAKYDAWAAMLGTSAQSAMQQYIALVDSLRR